MDDDERASPPQAWTGRDLRPEELPPAVQRGDDERARAAVAGMTISPANVKRAREIEREFRREDEESGVGERLLLELVAGESALALELQDIEGALLGLIGKAIANPNVALAVTKTLREVVLVSNAVRRRMENSLGAAENLKAQRRFLRAQRG